jgi:hypothetical protein
MRAVWSIWPATWNQLVFKMESPNRQLPVVVPAVRNYMIVTAAYWGFTLTDGAAAHAGAPSFLQTGLLTLHAVFVIFALRSGWGACQFDRRLAGDKIWYCTHAHCGSDDSDCWIHSLVAT